MGSQIKYPWKNLTKPMKHPGNVLDFFQHLHTLCFLFMACLKLKHQLIQLHTGQYHTAANFTTWAFFNRTQPHTKQLIKCPATPDLYIENRTQQSICLKALVHLPYHVDMPKRATLGDCC